MKVSEEFVIDESSATVWEFFEQLDRVARCVPGMEEVTIVDADNSRVRVTQALGPMTATFDVKMRITARDPGRSLEFTAVGRSVRGAAGNVRATHVVRLEDQDESSTRVLLEGDLALGGMLGSIGQKVVAKQASIVTQSFAKALQQELSGGSAAATTPAATAPAATDDAEAASGEDAGPGAAAADGGEAELGAGAPADPERTSRAALAASEPRSIRSVVVAGGIALAILLLVVRSLRSRSAHTF
jgi:uncharacterized protein